MTNSVLKNQAMRGPIYSQGAIQPKGEKKKMPLVFSLNLTALIDAFSMLVIFLLSSMSSDTSVVNMNHKVNLPTAVASDLAAMGTVIRVQDGLYYIDEKPTDINGLAKALVDLKIKTKDQAPEMQGLVIQADRGASYDVLSPVLKAGGQAGFHQFKFAVLQDGRK